MIRNIKINDNVLEFVVDESYETVLLLLKTFLNENKNIIISGIKREHYLIDKVIFTVVFKKGVSPYDVLKEVIDFTINKLENLKV